MAKPDDRSDNVEKLQENVQNTLQNLHETEDYLNKFSDELSSKERHNLEAKNERRKNSIDSFRSEIKDEANS